jgi:2-(1,2-epoxy-1,2-dihydrophenyl)acetyl-CoA isomerase
MADTLLKAQQDGVTTLLFNRPQVRNALDAEIMSELREQVEACQGDGTRVIVIGGAGGAFSSGANIAAALQSDATADAAYRILTEVYGPTLLAIRNSPLPVIAAMDGVAAGLGCDLALACDLRLLSERGAFAELFIRVGLVPDGGGTYHLPRLVGVGRALELMWTGRTVGADEAVQIGLANVRFPVETFVEDVQQYAAKIAGQAPLALTRGKRAVYAAQDGSFEEALQREAELQHEIFRSEDGWEGFRAFAEKRPPRWEGH